MRLFGASTRGSWRRRRCGEILTIMVDDHGSIKALQCVAIETEKSPPFRCVCVVLVQDRFLFIGLLRIRPILSLSPRKSRRLGSDPNPDSGGGMLLLHSADVLRKRLYCLILKANLFDTV